MLLFHPFLSFQNFTDVRIVKLRFLVQRDLLKQFLFSVMCWKHTASPGGFLSGWYISFLQILKQDFIRKVWKYYLAWKHSVAWFWGFFFVSCFCYCFILSLWVIGRPAHMLLAMSDSPPAVAFPMMATITLLQKLFKTWTCFSLSLFFFVLIIPAALIKLCSKYIIAF